nr:MAG TPA: minor capsid protein [Caudoviricetes sp.]
MSRYPFTPELLDALPEDLAELFRALELVLLDEICSRLKAADELNEVTVQDIRALRSHGIDLKEIKKAIREISGISKTKLDKLLGDVVARNQQYYTDMIDLAHITQPETLVDAAEVAAIRAQTLDTFRNLTASMGFLVDAGRTMLPPAKAYQWALDSAALQVQSGAINYNQAIKTAVKELADSGLKVVDYESGHQDHVDVAVRRAVMTGVSQICAKYTKQSAEYLDTPYFEVSAHVGARDKPGPSPWSSHKDWQGRVYSVRAGDIYPSIYDVCGLGAVDGLEGANCRHRRFPWVDGVSERTYTDEQLEHIDDGHGCTFDGKDYTAYEATQMQRRIERTVRKLKREKAAYKAAGLHEDETAANIRLRRLNAKYKAFSAEAGLPEQPERMRVYFTDDATLKTANAMKTHRAEVAAANAKDDSDTLKFFGADARDNLNSIVKRRTMKLENGFACFPDGDPLNENVKRVKPLKTYFDVAMHGSQTAVGFGSVETNMSPRLLASVIRHSNGWNGQKVRLLSCDTGKRIENDYCFAEELANALGVKVKAPTDVLYIPPNGEMYVGDSGEGYFETYKPNERGRVK